MSLGPPALRGELGVVGVFDVCELLRLNRMTGPLVLSYQDLRGMLLFEEGMIVNAVDDTNHEGPDAAYSLFTWRGGSFEFRQEPIVTSRLITESTEGLMMEAARRLDESGELPEGEPRAAEQLREHLGRFAALREAFRNLSREDGGEPRAGGEDTGTQLESLRDADDRLVLRPHAPPRLCTGGTWVSASSSMLPAEAYEGLRRELLGPRDVRGNRMGLPDGRALWVQAVGDGADEALWIRPIELDPPARQELSGPVDRLVEHLAAPAAVMIVAGHSHQRSERLIHAVLQVVGESMPATRIVVAPCACYRRPAGPGVTLDVAPALASAAIESVGPDLVAIDPGVPLTRELLGALARVPRLVFGVVATDPATATARFQAALEFAGGERYGVLLEGTRIAIACEEPRPDQRISFTLNALPGSLGGARSGTGSSRTGAPH